MRRVSSETLWWALSYPPVRLRDYVTPPSVDYMCGGGCLTLRQRPPSHQCPEFSSYEATEKEELDPVRKWHYGPRIRKAGSPASTAGRRTPHSRVLCCRQEPRICTKHGRCRLAFPFWLTYRKKAKTWARTVATDIASGVTQPFLLGACRVGSPRCDSYGYTGLTRRRCIPFRYGWRP